MGAALVLLMLPVTAAGLLLGCCVLSADADCQLCPVHPQVPKEYLHSAELRDIMQFGSSSQVRSGSWRGRVATGSSSRPPRLLPKPAPFALPKPCPVCVCPQAVFFKMRVAGVLHIFQFETKQGEDICMALQVRCGAGVGAGSRRRATALGLCGQHTGLVVDQ